MQLTENEIRGLCLKSRELFLSQPILLELEAPLKICGKKLFGLSYSIFLLDSNPNVVIFTQINLSALFSENKASSSHRVPTNYNKKIILKKWLKVPISRFGGAWTLIQILTGSGSA